MLKYSAQFVVSCVQLFVHELLPYQPAGVESQHLAGHPVAFGHHLGCVPPGFVLCVKHVGEGMPSVVVVDVYGSQIPLLLVPLLQGIVATIDRKVEHVLNSFAGSLVHHEDVIFSLHPTQTPANKIVLLIGDGLHPTAGHNVLARHLLTPTFVFPLIVDVDVVYFPASVGVTHGVHDGVVAGGAESVDPVDFLSGDLQLFGLLGLL